MNMSMDGNMNMNMQGNNYINKNEGTQSMVQTMLDKHEDILKRYKEQIGNANSEKSLSGIGEDINIGIFKGNINEKRTIKKIQNKIDFIVGKIGFNYDEYKDKEVINRYRKNYSNSNINIEDLKAKYQMSGNDIKDKGALLSHYEIEKIKLKYLVNSKENEPKINNKSNKIEEKLSQYRNIFEQYKDYKVEDEQREILKVDNRNNIEINSSNKEKGKLVIDTNVYKDKNENYNEKMWYREENYNNNNINNNNDNEYNYDEILPIIHKVSQLKEIYSQDEMQRDYSNKEDKKDIRTVSPPKLISKRQNSKGKPQIKKKLISFDEFLKQTETLN